MKRFLLLLFAVFLYMTAFAQLEVKEGSFHKVEGFVNINLDKMTDDNEQPYAVLKIKTENIGSKERRELNFGGDARTFFEVEYKDGEVWLYISYYASYIKISHEELSSTEFYFPFDMEPKKGYELTLVNKANAVVSGWAALTVTTKPENGAKVLLNGRDVNAITPYTNNMIPSGKYDITVAKNKFVTTTTTIEIHDGEYKDVEIEMPYMDVQFALDSEGQTFSKGAINGVFSVAADKKVVFSKGNLQYQASTKIWRFAEYQWDIVGEANKNISSNYRGWIDLFGWGTGDNPTCNFSDGHDYVSFNEWGNNIISDGDNNKWRTLTKDEWTYVFDKRYTSSGIRYVKAIVNKMNGVILLPDNWDASNYKLNYTNNNRESFFSNHISLSDWMSIFENNGAVFLPAAGSRGGSIYNNGGCNYWSSTYDKGIDYDAYGIHIYNDFIIKDSWDSRSYGYSVRLVTDIE